MRQPLLPATVLFRESYREHGKVKKRTLANLCGPHSSSKACASCTKRASPSPPSTMPSTSSAPNPHGHVDVRSFARTIGLDRLLGPALPLCNLALALVLSRLLGSRLQARYRLRICTPMPCAIRARRVGTAELHSVDENDLYACTPPWTGCAVACWLSAFTRATRDGKRNTLQIEFAPVCNRDGCPAAVAVFDDNTDDPSTVAGVLTESASARISSRPGLDQCPAHASDRSWSTWGR